MNAFNDTQDSNLNVQEAVADRGKSTSSAGVACKLKLAQRISVRVQDHLAFSLERIAATQGVRTSDLVRQLVVEALRSRYDTAAGMCKCGSHLPFRQTSACNTAGEKAQ
jgi:hypothetical protein